VGIGVTFEHPWDEASARELVAAGQCQDKLVAACAAVVLAAGEGSCSGKAFAAPS